MKYLLLCLIRFYRRALSPLKPACCRFYPTCSEYALQAIAEYGALRGGLLAVWRILRCNPFCKGGYDPVPRYPQKTKQPHRRRFPPHSHSYTEDAQSQKRVCTPSDPSQDGGK